MKSSFMSPFALRMKHIGRFFSAHNATIYIVLFISVLIGAVFGLNLALSQPSDETYRSQKMNEAQSARFDTETIQKIKTLNARQQTNTDATAPGTRSNPFGE